MSDQIQLGVTQTGNLLGKCLMSDCYYEHWYHYMRAWIRILHALSCYEHVAALRRQRESPHYKAQDWSEL